MKTFLVILCQRNVHIHKRRFRPTANRGLDPLQAEIYLEESVETVESVESVETAIHPLIN